MDIAQHPPLPRGVIAAITVGYMGFGILLSLLGTLLVYFYLPPRSAGLPTLVTDTPFLGVLNAVALIASAGRLTDSITDLLVATWSDRCRSRWGRRIPFMAAGTLPACAALILIFVPPVQEVSWINIVYLLGMQIVLFTFLSCYITPMNALVADIGSTPQERLRATVWASIGWGFGTIIATQTFFVAPMLQSTFTPLRSWQVSIAAACALAGVAMFVPVFAIDEPRWTRSQPCTTPLIPAVKFCLANRFYRFIVAADFACICSVSLTQSGLLYYVTVLLQLGPWLATAQLMGLVVLSILLSPFVGMAVRRMGGGKKLLVIAYVMAAVAMVLFSALGISQQHKYIQAAVPMILFGIPYTILSNIVFWVTSDIAEHASESTGQAMTGMFFATRTFIQKLGATCGVLIVALLLQLGRDVGDDLGIRLTALVAAGLCGIADIIVMFYDEASLQNEMKDGSVCRLSVDAVSMVDIKDGSMVPHVPMSL